MYHEKRRDDDYGLERMAGLGQTRSTFYMVLATSVNFGLQEGSKSSSSKNEE